MLGLLIDKNFIVSRFFLLLLFTSAAPQALAQSFEQVTVGAAHICALDADGQVECTTTPIATRMLPPDDLPLMLEISAGQQHTCGVTLDGGVECWGVDAFGVLGVPVFDAPVMSISSGFNHTCAIDINGQVRCWGLNTNGQLDVPDIAGGFVKTDSARNATCGIDTSGDIYCWSTDTSFTPEVPIPGPFVDLDIDANHACGLTANGDIECWASRERGNLSPPANGPYTDLTVTNSAICGLRTDQFLDCSFAAPTIFELDTRAEEYPLDVRFSSIERSNQQFGGVPICAVRADNGTISCFGDSGREGSLPAPPGVDPAATSINASNISLGLTAAIYARNQVELFWNQLPSAFPQIFVEVYRDDELLLRTPNGFSYYDNDSSVTSDESSYRVRTVDDSGNVGEFSNSIVVNRATLEVGVEGDTGSAENPRPEGGLQIQNISITAFAQFVPSNDSFVLTWNMANPADTPIAGFEIRIDNERVGFVSNTAFIGDGVNFDICRVYSVVAIGVDGSILDFSSAALGRSAIRCPRS